MSLPVYQNGSGFEDTLTGISLKTKLNYANNSYFIFGYEFANHDAKRKSLVYYSAAPIINYHRMTTLMDMTKQSILFSLLILIILMNFSLYPVELDMNLALIIPIDLIEMK